MRTFNSIQKALEEKNCCPEVPSWLRKRFPEKLNTAGLNCVYVTNVVKENGVWVLDFMITPTDNRLSLTTLHKELMSEKEILDLEYYENYDDVKGDERHITFALSFKYKRSKK